MTEELTVIMTNIPSADWSAPIDKQRRVIGRDQIADFVIPSHFSYVALLHAEVWADKSGAWIRDLNSSMVTRINGVRLDGTVHQAGIVAGDQISLGDLVLEVIHSKAVKPRVTEKCPNGSDWEVDSTGNSRQQREQNVFTRLTPAEVHVLLWISRGVLDNRHIGKRLHRSPHTVRTQVSSICKKLGLHSRGEILSWLKRRSDTVETETDEESRSA